MALIVSAEWQVSLAPFSSTELINPTGLVARGRLTIDSTDQNSIKCGNDITSGYANGGAGLIYYGKFPVHEFSIDFSQFAPAPDDNNPEKINYYVRVIALVPAGPGLFVGYSSLTRNFAYGPISLAPKIPLNERIAVSVPYPDVKMESYNPVRSQKGRMGLYASGDTSLFARPSSIICPSVPYINVAI